MIPEIVIVNIGNNPIEQIIFRPEEYTALRDIGMVPAFFEEIMGNSSGIFFTECDPEVLCRKIK